MKPIFYSYLTLALLTLNFSAQAEEGTSSLTPLAEPATTATGNVETTKAAPAAEKGPLATTGKTAPEPIKETSAIPPAVTATLKSLLNPTLATNPPVVVPSLINGLYEATIGFDVIYIAADGKHVLLGNLLDAKTHENLTDRKRDKLRVKAINSIAENEMIIFKPEKETKYTVNVFTDVDCGYCAKFHQEVPALNQAGVAVRYLAFPRAGLDSDTHKKMVSVWCAKDRQTAITDAKAKRDVPKAECDNPIRKEFELGRSMGVTGTPALVLEDGELVPGYVPADRLVSHLQQKAVK